jgi:hypothetical protein
MTVVDAGPAPVDLVGVRAGDRNLLVVTLTTNGAPVDLSGMTVRAAARLKVTDTDAVAPVVADIEVTNASQGTFNMEWPGDQVRTFLAGKASMTGVWDLEVESPPEEPVTIAAGKFVCALDVTR